MSKQLKTVSKQLSNFILFLYVIFFLSIPVYADASGIGFMLIAPFIFIPVFSFIFGAVHFYLTCKLLSIDCHYLEVFGYTFIGFIFGVLLANNFLGILFLFTVSIPAIVLPILILLIQKRRSRR